MAKSESAKNALEMLIPEYNQLKDQNSPGNIKVRTLTSEIEEDIRNEDFFQFFNDIRIEDERIPELCNKTSEPSPYAVLTKCLQK